MRKTAGSKTSKSPGKARDRSSSAKGSSADGPENDLWNAAALRRLAMDPALQIRIFAAATNYLKGRKELNIPGPWLGDLEGGVQTDSGWTGAHLQWLAFNAAAIGKQSLPDDPQGSYGYVRTGTGNEPSMLLVLLATLLWRDPVSGTKQQQLSGGQGLRVIYRAVPGQGPVAVAASTSLPAVPDGDVTAWNSALSSADVAYLYGDELAARLPGVAGLDPERYGTNSVGLRLDDVTPGIGRTPAVRFTARLVPRAASGRNAVPMPDPDAPTFAIEAVVRGGRGAPPQLDALRRYPLFAQLKPQVSRDDPPTKAGSIVLAHVRPRGVPSGRPNRSWRDLDRFRVRLDLGALPAAGVGRVKLEDPRPKPRFVVAQSRHVEGGSAGFDDYAPVVVPIVAPDASVRTDRFAAINAYLRAADFFRRVDDLYGLPMAVHFAFATLPIIVRYRAGIVPGAGDGRTINAQVRWAPPPPSAAPTTPTTMSRNLEVRLALADLQSNEGRVNAARRTGAVARAPLSIAAEPRWCWHEFGHVLIAGATGALELEFAHSVGDAIGAILCDPDSHLAGEGDWRGVTFPFQSLPNRRHDRKAADGWSWSGSHARPTRFFAGVGGHHALNRGGYCAEQIMSSTLFNLYRSLGGDARTAAGLPDTKVRRVAAEHSVALIMAGIGLFGHHANFTVRTAEDFAATLKAADSAMLPLTINGRKRYGGMAHKVIRWAFERQGAYPPPGAIEWANNGPGTAPDVDLFVASRRRGERGGYEAVTFADEGHRAAPDALWVRRRATGTGPQDPVGGRDNFVFVKVGNRGRSDANNTTVRVWRAKLTAGGAIPPWTARCVGRAGVRAGRGSAERPRRIRWCAVRTLPMAWRGEGRPLCAPGGGELRRRSVECRSGHRASVRHRPLQRR